jgi:hypothetical protein
MDVPVICRAPNPKFQAPNPNALPTSTFQICTAIGQLGLGSALELGIWSLGFDTLETTDTSPLVWNRVPDYNASRYVVTPRIHQ